MSDFSAGAGRSLGNRPCRAAGAWDADGESPLSGGDQETILPPDSKAAARGRPPAGRLSPRRRLTRVLAAAAVLGPSLAAWRVAPDRRGFGTHEQFGWPPCTVMAKLGVPCVTCGMTTAWAHCVRGEWIEAAACNSGGLLAWGLSGAAAGWWLATAAAGREPWKIGAREAAAIGLALATFAVLDWARRLVLAASG